MSDKHTSHRSKYTLDRQMPGAFEGETVTRRRFMVVGGQAAGGVAAASFLLPALGFAVGPIFKSTPHRWESVGPVDMFSETNYVPVVITLTPNIGEAGKSTAYVRKFNAAIDTDPYDKGTPYIAISSRCAHLGCPGALGRRGRALHLSLSRRRLRSARRPCRRAAAFVRSTASIRASTRAGEVELGPRFWSTASCGASRPRDPGEPATASVSTPIHRGRAHKL